MTLLLVLGSVAAVVYALQKYGKLRQKGIIAPSIPFNQPKATPALSRERQKLIRIIQARGLQKKRQADREAEVTSLLKANLIVTDKPYHDPRPRFTPDLSNPMTKSAFDAVKTAQDRIPLARHWEGEGRRVKAPHPFDIVIRFQGPGWGNEVTVQRVTVYSVNAVWHHDNTATPIYFDGFCHLFRRDTGFPFIGVHAAANPITGQLIEQFEQFIIDGCGHPTWKIRVS